MDDFSKTRAGAKLTLNKPNLMQGESGEFAAEIWNRIDAMQRRTQRLVWLDTSAALISTLVILFFGIAAIDWWARPSSFWGRGAMFACTIGLFLATTVFFVWRRWRRPISRMAIARRLEALFPQLGDRLSSVIAILESQQLERQRSVAGESSIQDSQLAGAAIQSAAVELQRCDPEKSVHWTSVLQSLVFAAVMLAIVVWFFVWRPTGASLAAQRLFSPTSDVQWPQRHRLALENVPESAHVGDSLEIFVRDALGPLPSDVELLVRQAAQTQVISLPLRLTGETAAGNLTIGNQDVEVRAIGGDDQTMSWRRIEVFAAPAIESYRITLYPPDYLGQEPFEIAESEFKVLAGTKMQFRARLSQPVQSAALVWKALGESPQAIPLRLTSDDSSEAPDDPSVTSTAASNLIESEPIPLSSTADFHVGWLDTNDLSGDSHRRWRVIVETDTAPSVVLESPESDQEVTLAATVAVLATARDNLGVASGWIEAQHVQGGLLGRLGLKDTQPPASSMIMAWNGTVSDLIDTISLGANLEKTDSQSINAANEAVESTGPPATIDLYQEGTTIELTGVAMDTSGQRGQSTTRRLRLVSPQTMQQTIARRQSEALRDLLEARTQQAIALEQTQSARARLGDTDAQRQTASDRIQAANAAQQAAARGLTDSGTSAQRQLNEALRRAVENGLQQDKLRELRDAIDSIGQNELPAARSALQQATENLLQGKTAQTEQQLKAAANAQQATLDQLDALVQSMRREDSQRLVNDQLSELAAAQARLNQQSGEVSQALNPQAERERLAERQRELARSAEQLAERLRDLVDSLQAESAEPAGTDPGDSNPALANVQDALQVLEQGVPEPSSATVSDQALQGSTASAMRQAASELQRGRAGQAQSLQQQAQQQLEEARRRLDGSASTSNTAAATPSADARQSFAMGVQQALQRQGLIVEQLQKESNLSLQTLAVDQASVAELTITTAKNPEAPPGFDAALQDAAVDMQTAAALMQRNSERETATETANAARERMRFIVESLLSGSSSQDSQSEQDGDAQPADKDQTEQQQGVPTETLKLLRATQDFLRTRTEEIVQQQSAFDPVAVDPVRAARLESQKRQLASEQTRLVERIEQFVKELELEQNNEP